MQAAGPALGCDSGGLLFFKTKGSIASMPVTPCKEILWQAFALLLLIAPALVLAQQAPEGWNLVWADEFEGPEIDSSKWTHEVNAWGGGNNELQFYTARPENSFIEDGRLVIRAKKETYTAVDPSDGQTKTRNYTSARLNSRNKGDWLYGRFEIRAKVPGRQGLWPAIWMLPTDWAYGGWAASGEIDIMEHRGDQPQRLYNTIHFGAEWPDNVYEGTSNDLVDLTQDFHIYALEWEETEMRWYFDGELAHQTNSWFSENGAYPAPFDRRFHLLLNVAVGGDFLPDPPPSADYFPRQMEVDYVRVFERDNGPLPEQTPWNGQPATIPGRIEGELYDQGGQGVAYSDSDAENVGQSGFRPDEGVDIGDSNDTDDGLSVGWFESAEWMEYTVEAETAGTYAFAIRHASPQTDLSVRLEFFRNDELFGTLARDLSSTGGWVAWATSDVGEIALEEGGYIIRVTTIGSESFNFNYLDVTRQVSIESDAWFLTGN